MTTRGCLFSAITCLAIMALILFGGLSLSFIYKKMYRTKIDKNGTLLKGVLIRKSSSSKGKTIFWEYKYKNDVFQNNDEPSELFEDVELGDSVLVKIDTLNPANSYLLPY